MKNESKDILHNMKIITLLFSLVLLSGCGSGKDPQMAEQKVKPNVVMLIVDDMNDYGWGGAENLKTPNMDKLREQSAVFNNSYCPAPVCIPSRAATLTGISPHKSGVYLNGGDPWNASEELMEAETLAELFKRNGYYTYGRGKIYHKDLEEGRLEKNFDNRPIYEGGFGPFPDEEHRVHSEKDIFSKFWGVQAFDDSEFPDNINTEAVMEFLEEDQDKPFFITLGLWRPHTPFTAPQRFFDLYDPDTIPIPEAYKKNDLDDIPEFAQKLLDPFGRFEVAGADNVETWKRFLHGYYAATSFADWNVGRIMKAIEDSPHADNTIFIFFTDNGFHVGAKNHWEKNTLWEASALSPMSIKMPNGFTSTIDSPVGLIDLFPTLVDLCNLNEPGQELDGQSLRPFLENEDYEWDRPGITYFGENMLSIRTKNYRFIQYPDGAVEFYDHTKDPNEFDNLANDQAYEGLIKEHEEMIPEHFAKELAGRRN